MTKLEEDFRRTMMLIMASARFTDSDGVEVDSDAKVSEGDDNGAYVQAWVWVDFEGTPLCKAQHIEPIVRGEGCRDDDCPCWPDSVQP